MFALGMMRAEAELKRPAPFSYGQLGQSSGTARIVEGSGASPEWIGRERKRV
jgi:hypothetical protein